MEHDLNTTQRLVADHRESLESAARRNRLVKGNRASGRRLRFRPFSHRNSARTDVLATREHPAVA